MPPTDVELQALGIDADGNRLSRWGLSSLAVNERRLLPLFDDPPEDYRKLKRALEKFHARFKSKRVTVLCNAPNSYTLWRLR